jgi:hypothetical protein
MSIVASVAEHRHPLSRDEPTVGGLNPYVCSPNASEQSVPRGRRAAVAVNLARNQADKRRQRECSAPGTWPLSEGYQIHPFSRAIRYASAREPASSFWVIVAR